MESNSTSSASHEHPAPAPQARILSDSVILGALPRFREFRRKFIDEFRWADVDQADAPPVNTDMLREFFRPDRDPVVADAVATNVLRYRAWAEQFALLILPEGERGPPCLDDHRTLTITGGLCRSIGTRCFEHPPEELEVMLYPSQVEGHDDMVDVSVRLSPSPTLQDLPLVIDFPGGIRRAFTLEVPPSVRFDPEADPPDYVLAASRGPIPSQAFASWSEATWEDGEWPLVLRLR